MNRARTPASKDPDGMPFGWAALHEELNSLPGANEPMPRHIDPIGDYLLIDPDCRAGKHASCVGGVCACECHTPRHGCEVTP